MMRTVRLCSQDLESSTDVKHHHRQSDDETVRRESSLLLHMGLVDELCKNAG